MASASSGPSDRPAGDAGVQQEHHADPPQNAAGGRRPLDSAAPLLTVALSAPAWADRTPSPKDTLLYILWPHDGDRLRGAFWCRFGLRNMGITHAGDATPNFGHHHLLVDVGEPLNP